MSEEVRKASLKRGHLSGDSKEGRELAIQRVRLTECGKNIRQKNSIYNHPEAGN